ncbi:hypothetical protein KKP04_11930 [Rhodomicrobium sp. Az07]|uniref:hypothetical protein n=1 Tax=Rhodomicrobium sp. Az07 TaxID=2839034 RepID=UPI001BE6513F|nr:hypothetical protein [Rhodomicrobium sp. Az07]MBT3071575.1 hypothetical protein [Rhodomicrobium sp. Az07]
MATNLYELRRDLTFAQAEGLEPVSKAARLREVTPQLRALLWRHIYASMSKSAYYPPFSRSNEKCFSDPWRGVLLDKQVELDFGMADEFDNSWDINVKKIKSIFVDGGWAEFYGFLQWLLRHRSSPLDPACVTACLEQGGSAYRLLEDGKTLFPVTSDEEMSVVNRVFESLAGDRFTDARLYLRNAADALVSRRPAQSIREAKLAVYATACIVCRTNSPRDAFERLESDSALHPAPIKALTSLCEYLDAQGEMATVANKAEAKVDEADAMLMIGACASFVSYLINKSQNIAAK